MPARILVGSCSWTDPTLIACGRFYPPGVTSAEARLRYYAEQFDIVEVDSTYYAPPSARNSELWAARTPAGFVFNVKAFGLLTHHPAVVERLPDWLRNALPEEARGKRNVYAKDFAAGGHGAASGSCTARRSSRWRRPASWAPCCSSSRRGSCARGTNRDYLRRPAGAPARLAARGGVPRRRLDGRRRPPPAPCALLEEAGLAYVGVDEPQGFPNSTPPLAAATAPLADRPPARAQRRHLGEQDRRGVRPLQVPLQRRASSRSGCPRVRELAAQTQAVHVLFNNNYEDWGMQNARRMAHLLGVETQPPQTRLELS